MVEDAPFAAVVRWYKLNAPKHAESLRPSAGLNAIRAAEAETGTAWHPSIVAWFSQHDGAPLNSRGLLPDHRLLPLAEALEMRTMMLEVEGNIEEWTAADDDYDPEPQESEYDEGDESESISIEPNDDGGGVGAESDAVFWTIIEDESWTVSPAAVDSDDLEKLRLRQSISGGASEEVHHGDRTAHDENSEAEVFGEGSRFASHHLPIAAWDDDVILVDLASGVVSRFETVDGISQANRWHSLDSMLEWLLSALNGDHGFFYDERASIVDGELSWDD